MLEIRPARAAEFPAVADVCEAASAPYLQPNGHYRAVLRDVARRASAAELLVATEDERVLGTVTLVADAGPLGEIAGPMLDPARDARRTPRLRARRLSPGAGAGLVAGRRRA